MRKYCAMPVIFRPNYFLLYYLFIKLVPRFIFINDFEDVNGD